MALEAIGDALSAQYQTAIYPASRPPLPPGLPQLAGVERVWIVVAPPAVISWIWTNALRAAAEPSLRSVWFRHGGSIKCAGHESSKLPKVPKPAGGHGTSMSPGEVSSSRITNTDFFPHPFLPLGSGLGCFCGSRHRCSNPARWVARFPLWPGDSVFAPLSC